MGYTASTMRFFARILFYLDMEYELQDRITIEVSLHDSVVQENHQIKQSRQ